MANILLNARFLVIILGAFFVLVIGGCGDYRYFGRATPPAEAYWSKSGYTIHETRRFMDEKCHYKELDSVKNEDFWREYYKFENCMLNNNFSYMKDAYDITNRGFLPLGKEFVCKKREGRDISPGCKSIN